jgi:hypothetical protein
MTSAPSLRGLWSEIARIHAFEAVRIIEEDVAQGPSNRLSAKGIPQGASDLEEAGREN